MFYNFLKPAKTFESALNNEDYSGSITIAIVTAVIFALASFFYNNSIYSSVFVLLSFVIQWFVLTALLYIFEFVVKNKKKQIADRTFREIATGTGKLWTIPLIISVALMAIVVLNNEVVTLLAILTISVLGLLYLFNLYSLVRITLQAKTKRAIISWILLIILHNLIMLTTLSIAGIIF